jgi:uncharacterized DUF497 family protein
VRIHGIDFSAAREFNWDWAIRWIDDRFDYGETREVALGFIGVNLHVMVFTEREDANGTLTWIISLRRANRAEQRRYEQEAKT